MFYLRQAEKRAWDLVGHVDGDLAFMEAVVSESQFESNLWEPSRPALVAQAPVMSKQQYIALLDYAIAMGDRLNHQLDHIGKMLAEKHGDQGGGSSC